MKKTKIIAAILILICLLGVWVFFPLDRAGGEVGFEATVTSLERELVYASVTRDDAGFGSKNLPERIVIYTEDFPENESEVGDKNQLYLHPEGSQWTFTEW